MIGDKLFNMPRTVWDVKEIYTQFGLKCNVTDEDIFTNASKLVDINNEIFDKHNNITWLRERISIVNNQDMKL